MTIPALAALVLTACGGSVPPPSTGPAFPPPAVDTAVAAPAPPPAMTAALGGRVISAADQTPVPRARVLLTSPALPHARVALTDATGAYRFSALPPGAYSVTVSRTGFATQQFGERRSAPAAIVPLGEGEHLARIDVALAPAGSIGGRILDEDGTPLAGASVEALAFRLRGAQQTLVPVTSTRSDDRGEFRLIGLPAGEYVVSAFDPAFANVGDETGPLRYAATYFPGVVLAQDARLVRVPAAEPSRIEFRLRVVRPAAVSGSIATSDGRQLLSGAVIMSPVGGEAAAAVPSEDVTILPDGRFSFRNVTPGRYQIRARGETDPKDAPLFATYQISVEGRDIDHVAIVLAPGASLEGTIEARPFGGGKPPDFAGVRVRAPLTDGTAFGDALSGVVQPDGSFRIRGLMAGAHFVTVEGLPQPWILQSVTVRGRDVTDLPLEAQSGEPIRDVRVVITDVGTEVGGLVRDPQGRPAEDALVIACPADPALRGRGSRRWRAVRSGADGRYAIRGLPPGDYRLLAAGDLDEAEARRPDVLERLLASAVPLALKERDVRTVDLPLPTARGPR